MRAPTFGEIAQFLQHDKDWEPDHKSDHIFYEKRLTSGEVLNTHVSKALDKSPGRGRFGQILKYQLKVTEDEFWAVIREKRPARREQSAPAPTPTEPALSLNLVLQLRKQLGLTEKDMVGMTQDEAVRRLQKHYSKPKPKP